MPVRTRASAPANRVYSSPAALQQAQFKPRRKLVTYRHSTGGTRRSRQSTLTQIDFVNLQHLEDDEEIENKKSVKRKRGRTEESERTSTSRYQTQTLTQLEFVSTPAEAAEDLYDHSENNFNRADDGFKLEPNTQPGVGNISQPTIMAPPKTPRRRRVYEVPSSQSPASPASSRSRRSFNRSPLQIKDANIRVILSPKHIKSRPNLKEAELGDGDGFVKDEHGTHRLAPIASCGNISSDGHFISNPRKWTKEEIQDSDDEDLKTSQDDYNYESQVEKDLLGSSDTQEAENQLQSNILQFTQPESCFTPQVLAMETMEKRPPPRPSQATTVSLSQSQGQNRSSPTKSSVQIEESEGSIIDEDYDTITESTSNWVSATHLQSLSPVVLPQLRNSAQPGTSTINSDPHVPLYFSSSQLLTRSQMLPESLMQDSAPAPPLIIEDSDLDE